MLSWFLFLFFSDRQRRPVDLLPLWEWSPGRIATSCLWLLHAFHALKHDRGEVVRCTPFLLLTARLHVVSNSQYLLPVLNTVAQPPSSNLASDPVLFAQLGPRDRQRPGRKGRDATSVDHTVRGSVPVDSPIVREQDQTWVPSALVACRLCTTHGFVVARVLSLKPPQDAPVF